jgi:hypothetical protein
MISKPRGPVMRPRTILRAAFSPLLERFIRKPYASTPSSKTFFVLEFGLISSRATPPVPISIAKMHRVWLRG